MGTEKRERQKANRAKRQAEEAKAARSSAVQRNAVRWVIVAIAAVAAVVLIAWIGGAFDSDENDVPTTTLPLETLAARRYHRRRLFRIDPDTPATTAATTRCRQSRLPPRDVRRATFVVDDASIASRPCVSALVA